MTTNTAQLHQIWQDSDGRDFVSSTEYDHPIHTLVFGNRMCGKLEVVPGRSNETTIVEVSETASKEIEISESHGTIIFTRRTSPYSIFRHDNAEDRHETLIRVTAPRNTLRRVCSHKRLATVTIKDYEAEEFSVNASRGGSVYLENLNCVNFSYEAVSGACTIHAKSLNVENLMGVAYSSAHVLISGRTVNRRFACTNKAIVDARQLETQEALLNCFETARTHLGNVQSLKLYARHKARVFLNQKVSLDADSVSRGHLVF